MGGRRLNWDKAKFDSIRGELAPTGEDIDPVEEAALQAAHDANKGIYQPETPDQRDMRTLDLPTEEDRKNLVNSTNTQVELRERRRNRVEQRIKAGEATAKKRRAERTKVGYRNIIRPPKPR